MVSMNLQQWDVTVDVGLSKLETYRISGGMDEDAIAAHMARTLKHGDKMEIVKIERVADGEGNDGNKRQNIRTERADVSPAD